MISVAHLLPNPELSVGHMALALLKREANRFSALSKVVASSDDAEVAHDMRVACRRLRVAIQDFAPFLPRWVAALDGEIQWAFQALGAVRDLDVQILALKKMCPDSHARRSLLATMEEDRDGAAEFLGSCLKDRRFESLLQGLARLASLSADDLSQASDVPLPAIGPEIIQARFRKVAKQAKDIGPDAEAAEIHEFRKSAKRFRYSLEMTAGMYGRPARRVLRRLKAVQDAVGAYVDSIVALQHLQGLLFSGRLNEDALELAKDLIEIQEQKVEEASYGLRGPWKRVRGKAWNQLRKAMKEESRRTLESSGAQTPDERPTRQATAKLV